MQLTGTQFTDTAAFLGNDLSTFPEFPAEIRAPIGTTAGVSGFQVHFGSKEIFTPGDEYDVVVAMNSAALKVDLHRVEKRRYHYYQYCWFRQKEPGPCRLSGWR